MKSSSIFWGVFFVMIGALLLLGNYTDFTFTWSSAWKFWPVVLVLIGSSILIKNKAGKLFIAAIAGFILALTLYASVSATTNVFRNGFVFDFDDEYVDYDTTYFYEDYSDSIKTGTINFTGGAGEFRMLSPTERLAEFKAIGYAKNYELKRNDDENSTEMDFNMKKTDLKLGKKNYRNSVEISLNSNPEWELNFDVGAASVDLDLTQYKVAKVDVDMGAAALNLKLGDLAENAHIIIDAGASDIDILVPENVGCEIKSDDALSSKNFSGFIKVKKDHYKTSNFDESEKKIYLDLQCGVSSIDVRTY